MFKVDKNKILYNVSKNSIKTSLAEKNFDALTRIILDFKDNSEKITDFLNKNCEKYSENAYIYENNVLMQADEYLAEQLDRLSLNLNVLNSKSTLRFKEKFNISEKEFIYRFSVDNTKNLIEYNKKNVTDSAKTDFYKEMKNLIETGRVDKNEILNQKYWYCSDDGMSIYNLSPDITGNLINKEKDTVSKQLFDKLFNE